MEEGDLQHTLALLNGQNQCACTLKSAQEDKDGSGVDTTGGTRCGAAIATWSCKVKVLRGRA